MKKGRPVDLTDPRVERKLRQARLGHLATAGPQGDPLVVPVCLASNGRAIFTPLDRKPKRLAPERLRRVRHIRANPGVALVIDHYEEDWSKLWFILIRGRASLMSRRGTRERREALALLREKYPQYRNGLLSPGALIIRIVPTRLTLWGKVG